MCVCVYIDIGIDADIISYALLESGIRPDIQPKSSISHEAEPSGIWMTEIGVNFAPYFPITML